MHLFHPRLTALSDTLHPPLVGSNSVPTRATRSPVSIESMRDVARGLSKRITLTQLVSYDQYVRPYLAALLVAAVASMGEELVIPSSLRLRRVTEQEFEDYLASMSN